MEKSEISKELDTKIKIPKEEKEKIYSKMIKNFFIAICIFIYICFLNLGYMKLESDVFKTDLKVFAFSLIILTIILFEKAYKEDSGKITIYGIEMLVLSIITLYLPYVYFYKNDIVRIIFETSSIYIAMYYTIKCMVIYVREVKKYKNSLSDIKEIMTEKFSYIDEKSNKKFS